MKWSLYISKISEIKFFSLDISLPLQSLHVGALRRRNRKVIFKRHYDASLAIQQ